MCSNNKTCLFKHSSSKHLQSFTYHSFELIAYAHYRVDVSAMERANLFIVKYFKIYPVSYGIKFLNTHISCFVVIPLVSIPYWREIITSKMQYDFRNSEDICTFLRNSLIGGLILYYLLCVLTILSWF